MKQTKLFNTLKRRIYKDYNIRKSTIDYWKNGGRQLDSEYLVSMEDITKEFPGVKALDKVNFNLKKGEVHVLLGENGAGKSTLMKILCGAYPKDSGKIYIDNDEVNFTNVKDAKDAGVSIIYQELNLISNLTIAENIFIGEEPIKNGIIDWKSMYQESQKYLDNLKLNISSKSKIKDLGIAEQQMIEVARSLSKNSKLIIMDEPTSALTDTEIQELFRTIRDLKAQGVGIIYISHRLEELTEIGDRVTVLRDGKYIQTKEIKDVTKDDLIHMMVGRNLKNQYPKVQVDIGDELLRVEGISTKDKLNNCSFSLKKGEILALSGLMGAGRTELARALIGADPIISGEVYINGEKISIKSPEDAVKNRIGYLPEDRKAHGLVLGLSVDKNITLGGLKQIKQNGILNLKREKEISAELVESLQVKTPNLSQKVKFLSGGNQQKVVTAKWLFTETDILIFDEPTRGIDVGAKVEIYKIMCELVKQGKAIILISSELPEVLGMGDRVLVMGDGEIKAQLCREHATQDKILEFAIGAVTSDKDGCYMCD